MQFLTSFEHFFVTWVYFKPEVQLNIHVFLCMFVLYFLSDSYKQVNKRMKLYKAVNEKWKRKNSKIVKSKNYYIIILLLYKHRVFIYLYLFVYKILKYLRVFIFIYLNSINCAICMQFFLVFFSYLKKYSLQLSLSLYRSFFFLF
jgi:hypothetical protein